MVSCAVASLDKLALDSFISEVLSVFQMLSLFRLSLLIEHLRHCRGDTALELSEGDAFKQSEGDESELSEGEDLLRGRLCAEEEEEEEGSESCAEDSGDFKSQWTIERTLKKICH